jgi:hypothetical protein
MRRQQRQALEARLNQAHLAYAMGMFAIMDEWDIASVEFTNGDTLKKSDFAHVICQNLDNKELTAKAKELLERLAQEMLKVMPDGATLAPGTSKEELAFGLFHSTATGYITSLRLALA